ncbi:MAG: PilN domain-containing protein [Candidatus Omnitrophota bacterium]
MFAAQKKKETVVVSLTATGLKIGCLRISGQKKELQSLFYKDITGVPEADVAKAALEAVVALKLKDPLFLTVIPSQVVITKNIEVPSTNPREIKEIISLQAGRHTPYSREEVIVDHIDIGVYKKNYTKILMVIVTSKVIKKQLELLGKAGIKAEKIFFVPETIAWAAGKFLRLDTNTLPVAFLHVDRDSSDFTVVYKSKVIFVRSIPLGSMALAKEPEKYNPKLCEEVKKSFEAYQAEDIEKNPKLLYLIGSVDKLEGACDSLQELLKISIKPTPYMKNISLSREVIEYLSEDKGVSFFDIVSSLSGAEDARVNLIPEEVKLKQILQKRGQDLLQMGILFLTILVLGFFMLLSNIYFKAEYVKILDEKLIKLDEQTSALEADFMKITLMRDYFSGQGYALDVIGELVEQVPGEIELNEIRYDGQGKLSVKGIADSMSSVFGFVDSLSKTQYFKEVKTRYTTKRKEAGQDVVDFEINSLLQKGKR